MIAIPFIIVGGAALLVLSHVRAYKKNRSYYLSTLAVDQHIRISREFLGHRQIMHTFIIEIDTEKEEVSTPLGKIAFKNILS